MEVQVLFAATKTDRPIRPVCFHYGREEDVKRGARGAIAPDVRRMPNASAPSRPGARGQEGDERRASPLRRISSPDKALFDYRKSGVRPFSADVTQNVTQGSEGENMARAPFCILERTTASGRVFMARFYDAEGRVLRTKTLPGVKSPTAAARKAEALLKEGVIATDIHRSTLRQDRPGRREHRAGAPGGCLPGPRNHAGQKVSGGRRTRFRRDRSPAAGPVLESPSPRI